MTELKGKRILFLSAYFFGYYQEIIKAIHCQGAQVDYFDERPANTFLVKAMIRLRPEVLKKYIDRYHTAVIDKTQQNDYDYIFIIKAESISVESLTRLREKHPRAKMILYLWDSFANFKNGDKKLPFFDRILTFDKNDSLHYGMIFRPLFYTEDYVDVAQSDTPRDIDLLFIGTMHSDRYRFVKSIEQASVAQKLRPYFYLFFMSKILYYKMKFINPALRGTHTSDFHFKPIGKKEVLALFKRTKVIVDIQHPRQTGLTIRSIESLGACSKLITTNADICHYDFYHPDNIFVTDRENPVVPLHFFHIPYRKISDSLYQKYSIYGWLDDIFGNH